MPSFDISTGVDLQEVDNAVSQAMKDVAMRFDFEGAHCMIELDRAAASLRVKADDTHRLKALIQVLHVRLARRNVPLKNLVEGYVAGATMGHVRQVIAVKRAIDQETARRIAGDIRDARIKKVQVRMQGTGLRVSSSSRDALQRVQALVRGRDYGVELEFGNYRG